MLLPKQHTNPCKEDVLPLWWKQLTFRVWVLSFCRAIHELFHFSLHLLRFYLDSLQNQKSLFAPNMFLFTRELMEILDICTAPKRGNFKSRELKRPRTLGELRYIFWYTGACWMEALMRFLSLLYCRSSIFFYNHLEYHHLLVETEKHVDCSPEDFEDIFYV